MNQPKTVPLSLDLVNSILNYLSQQRFADVNGLIAEIQKQSIESVDMQEDVTEE